MVAADLVAQATDAVEVAHRAGIIHRALKPGNLLVTPEGRVKVTDFGIARAMAAAPLTRAGHLQPLPARSGCLMTYFAKGTMLSPGQ